ncbi:MAG: nuclear transport factor 2 family protein [Aeromicrobium sp.]|uniref:nuclear transport factor 2 family protein n=1 Tax=Aeromicrobium sp. TaxID=1871063 RepID=UPI0039E625FB
MNGVVSPAAGRARVPWPAVVLLGFVGAVAAGVLFGLVAGLAAREGIDRATPPGVPDPGQAVVLWDQAFRAGDCELFQQTTTADFRADYGQAEADYSTCDGFEEGLEEIEDGKPDDFWRTYELDVVEVRVDGDTARVETEETWEYLDGPRVRSASDSYTYDLVLVAGTWRIDDASFLDTGAEITT